MIFTWEVAAADDIIRQELERRAAFDAQYRSALIRLPEQPDPEEIDRLTMEAAKEITYRLAFDDDFPGIYKTPGERHRAYMVFLPPGFDPAWLEAAARESSMKSPAKRIPRLLIREVTDDLPVFPEVLVGSDENNEPVTELHPYRAGRWFYVEIHVGNCGWFGPAALGVVTTDADERNAEMVSMWVGDNLRGQGHGTLLIESAGQRWPDLRWTERDQSRPFQERLVENGISKPSDRSGYYQFVPQERRRNTPLQSEMLRLFQTGATGYQPGEEADGLAAETGDPIIAATNIRALLSEGRSLIDALTRPTGTLFMFSTGEQYYTSALRVGQDGLPTALLAEIANEAGYGDLVELLECYTAMPADFEGRLPSRALALATQADAKSGSGGSG